ncbi:MAG: hypothetical protein ACHREM_21390, partial [Polyangiales bacterium]
LAPLAVACGGAANPSPTTPTTASTSTSATIGTEIAPTDDDAGGKAAEVFARAQKEMDAGKLAHARLLFDRVVAADRAQTSDGATLTSMGRAAAYNGALCAERLEESKDARDRFRALALTIGDTADAIDAQLRRSRLDVEIEDYADLGVGASALLARAELLSGDRAEALAMQGIALLQRGDAATADKTIHAALKTLLPTDDALPASQNAAAVHFAHGELLRTKGDAIVFIPVTPDFPDKMEARCQSILDAQEAYIEAIKTHEMRWAVRAGLRVASMYIGLHDALLEIPPPASATTDDKRALFRGAMRLRYRILLEKGLGTLQRTLSLAPATGVKTTWLDRAREAKEQLEKHLADEKAEIAKLPYTEEQLQKALDDLATKKH